MDQNAESVNRVKPWEPSEKGLAVARRHLGYGLRARRKKADLTVARVAEIAGVSKATYERYEAGTAIAGPRQMWLLAQHYGCKGSELSVNEMLPGAPLDPVKRLEWVRERNRKIQAGNADVARRALGLTP